MIEVSSSASPKLTLRGFSSSNLLDGLEPQPLEKNQLPTNKIVMNLNIFELYQRHLNFEKTLTFRFLRKTQLLPNCVRTLS
ncbi:hypothetical protein EBQ74_00775 [bacterium]|nr:hypothetical protein [bacterium]